jgi:REP element-mobilizing transposase RayT
LVCVVAMQCVEVGVTAKQKVQTMRTVQKARKANKARPVQGALPFRSWGGARKGAGRKPKGTVAMVGHGVRAAHAAAHPALVTIKLRAGLPKLRQQRERSALLARFARGKDRFGFRLLHFSILNDHLHFVVEAKDRTALCRGLQGLLIRLARGLNKLWGRKGKVFADRYHDRALKSPREVRNALVYVLGNGRKHAAQGRAIAQFDGPDMFSSAPWFDGFVERIEVRGIEGLPPPVAAARTWLAGVGWRRHGRIGLEDVPRLG